MRMLSHVHVSPLYSRQGMRQTCLWRLAVIISQEVSIAKLAETSIH